MKTITLKKFAPRLPIITMVCTALIILIWWLIAHFQTNSLSAIVDPSLIYVVMIALGTWMILLQVASIIAVKLLGQILLDVQDYFQPIRKLTSWQQHVLYLALYALLVLSGTGCLIAIC